MPLPEIETYRNGKHGKHEAPEYGASPFRAPEQDAAPRPPLARTVFPPDLSIAAPRPLLYRLSRHQLAGLPLTRWLFGLLAAAAAAWAVGLFPGRWWGAALWALTAAGLGLAVALLRRADFVRFVEEPLPALPPQPLAPAEKLPIYATGLFSVEGKAQRFTAAPGFYRTFATREHAVLCLLRDRPLLWLAEWPPDHAGMWYIFIEPANIRRLRWGRLRYSRSEQPAVAVEHLLTLPAGGRRHKAQTRLETVFLAAEAADARRVLADLLHDPAAASAPHSADR